MKIESPKVWILGAGPGDPELITVKGLKTLQKADVILYDALVSTELLNYAPLGCKKSLCWKKKRAQGISAGGDQPAYRILCNPV